MSQSDHIKRLLLCIEFFLKYNKNFDIEKSYTKPQQKQQQEQQHQQEKTNKKQQKKLQHHHQQQQQ